MVGEDTGECLGSEIAQGGTDACECRVGRGEDGEVGRGINSLDELGSGECGDKRGQIGGGGSGGCSGRDGQEAVNYMNGTVVVGEIL